MVELQRMCGLFEVCRDAPLRASFRQKQGTNASQSNLSIAFENFADHNSDEKVIIELRDASVVTWQGRS